jgi:hypothetical protein
VNLTPEFNIDEYRSMAGFSVPAYAPANFVPLAWSDHDEGAVKFLKVPVGHGPQSPAAPSTSKLNSGARSHDYTHIRQARGGE